MPTDVLAFWAVLAAFLVVDNIVLVPPGGDALRCGWRGRLLYDAGTRLQLRGRDAFWLNPLNPFDRLLPTTAAAGRLAAPQWQATRRTVRGALPWLNRLSALGSAYLVLLIGLLAVSPWQHFGVVLALLGLLHLTAWTVAVVLLQRGRHALPLSTERRLTLAAEALFVPAYTINLAKRVLRHAPQDLPALAVGLHQLRQLRGDTEAEALARFRLGERLQRVEEDLDLSSPGAHSALHGWLQAARRCVAGHGR